MLPALYSHRCVGITLDLLLLFFFCCFMNLCLTFGFFSVLFASFLGSFWCPWALFWHPWALFWRPWAPSQKNYASGTNWERIRGPNRTSFRAKFSYLFWKNRFWAIFFDVYFSESFFMVFWQPRLAQKP